MMQSEAVWLWNLFIYLFFLSVFLDALSQGIMNHLSKSNCSEAIFILHLLQQLEECLMVLKVLIIVITQISTKLIEELILFDK